MKIEAIIELMQALQLKFKVKKDVLDMIGPSIEYYSEIYTDHFYINVGENGNLLVSKNFEVSRIDTLQEFIDVLELNSLRLQKLI
jgi:hypothetical protein